MAGFQDPFHVRLGAFFFLFLLLSSSGEENPPSSGTRKDFEREESAEGE
jgi:hypothetical protein